MPAVRFSRDKRGYEYLYLVHTPTRRGKPGRTRVLYWYRTPPGVRIGRKPFDDDVQRILEQQNPGVVFDWPALIKAEMPPPDMTEFWRERRRAEKAARQERRAAEAEEIGDTVVEPDGAEPVDVEVGEFAPEPAETGLLLALDDPGVEFVAHPDTEGADAVQASPAQKKRRRRRGGRRRKGAADAALPAEPGREADAQGDGGADPVDDDPF